MAKIIPSADQFDWKNTLLELTHLEQEYELKAKLYAKAGVL